jgi:hypothetical protein
LQHGSPGWKIVKNEIRQEKIKCAKKGRKEETKWIIHQPSKRKDFFVWLYAYPFIKYKLRKAQTALSLLQHKGQAVYSESKSLDS